MHRYVCEKTFLRAQMKFYGKKFKILALKTQGMLSITHANRVWT